MSMSFNATWDAVAFDGYADAHQDEFVAGLAKLCALPSISSQSDHREDVRATAEFLIAELIRLGFANARLIETPLHPVVTGTRKGPAGAPTVLLYGHYDVQPVDPLDQWTTPPFSSEIRNGALFARGAVDDKGQVWAHLKALECMIQSGAEPPVTLTVIFEGEEEIGSEHFESVVEAHVSELACDVAVISDTTMLDRQHPSICMSLRGLASLEISVRGPKSDLHSGEFGGAVANPVEVLAHMIASLKDLVSGRVLVPGFYEDVHALDDAERAALEAVPYSEDEFKTNAGVVTLVGEEGYSTVEKLWVRPTLELNGIWGGYQGEGSKTIIPESAHAKITCRLVPHQNPTRVAHEVKAHLDHLSPAGVTVDVRVIRGGNPVVVPLDNEAIRATADALEAVFHAPTLYIREGGSIPPADTLQHHLGVPVVLVGFGLQEENYHAPNEHFHIDMLVQSIKVVGRMWQNLASRLAKNPQQGATL